jgi:biotin carboxyl carrier protein
MPGRVVSVLVAPGDDVVERQPVVVLEAMKMQNEVRAARAGVVTEVTVASGAAVEAGAVLVVLGDPRATDGV